MECLICGKDTVLIDYPLLLEYHNEDTEWGIWPDDFGDPGWLVAKDGTKPIESGCDKIFSETREEVERRFSKGKELLPWQKIVLNILEVTTLKRSGKNVSKILVSLLQIQEKISKIKEVEVRNSLERLLKQVQY